MKINFLDLAGASFIIEKVKELFVQKEENKGLSEENYTKVEKDKLNSLKSYDLATREQSGLQSKEHYQKVENIQDGAEVNKIETIKRNGSIVSPVGKVVDIKVPTKYSELVNDEELISKAEAQQMIANNNAIRVEVVSALPSSGENLVIYMVGPNGDGDNIYEEFMWTNGRFEKIGDTATKVNLDGYIKEDSLSPITNEQIEAAFKS